MSAPLLDRRRFDALVDEVAAAAARLAPAWNQDAPDDAGVALRAVFAHYLELVLARLNRVPEKSLVAFLDLVGTGLLQPGAAAAPVAFSLTPTAGAFGFVPQGTQVATAQTQTSPAVVYETTDDLVVVAAQLTAAFTVDPVSDRWADRTEAVTTTEGIVFRPFVGEEPLDHVLYLGTPADRPVLHGTAGRLIVHLEPPNDAFFNALEWQVWRDGTWQNLPRPGVPGRTGFEEVHSSDLLGLTESGLTPAPTARWLRARPTGPVRAGDALTSAKIEHVGLLALTSVPALRVEKSPRDRRYGSVAGLAPGWARCHLLVNLKNPKLPPTWASLSVVWTYWNGTAWTRLGDVSITRAHDAYQERDLTDTTRGFQKSGWISFPRPANIPLGTPEGMQQSRWLRAEVTIKDAQGNAVEYLTEPKVRWAQFAHDLPLDGARLGTTQLDLASPFQPFGAQPHVGDAFYLGSSESFGQPGARATVFVALEQRGVPAPSISLQLRKLEDFVLAWEYYGANGWTQLGTTSIVFTSPRAKAQVAGDIAAVALVDYGQPYAFRRVRVRVAGVHDSTEGLSRDGELAFKVPSDMRATEVAGLRSYWIRALIAQGNYGAPPEYLPFTSGQTTTFVLRPGTGNLAPPKVRSVSAAYDYRSPLLPALVTRNGFDAADRTDENVRRQIRSPLLVPVEESEPTFYLGFDRALPNDAVNVYFVVPPRQVVEPLDGIAVGPTAMTGTQTTLAWEYWNGKAWSPLVVFDDTNDLAESGRVQFLGPEDHALLARLDATPRYWIRVRLVAAGSEYDPFLAGVAPNAVDAVQATTIVGEVVGSSTGAPRQRFRLTKAPVFPGQRVVVREPERPPATEEAAAEADEGPDAVRPVDGSFAVRWHEVETLLRSGRRDRHYTIDRSTGDLFFGDGMHGLVPPTGTDNIVCERYRSGGGAAGNQPAGAIAQLKTSIPFVAAVRNPIPADGGSAPETLPGALTRGPQRLRNRGRAISADDFEWLARQAAGTEVVRAQALPNRDRDLHFRLGWVTLVVVPAGTDRRLLPSAGLVKEVENFVAGRALATLTLPSPERINVIGPGYVPVQLRAELRPVVFTAAEAVRSEALAAIDAFLHPLTGGPDGVGWEFGRDVYLSELYALLEALPGVDHVHDLAFEPNIAMLPLTSDAAPTPTFALPAGSPLTYVPAAAGAPPVTAALLEPLPPRVPAAQAMVAVVREGEPVEIGDADPRPRTTVRTVTGATLAVDPFRTHADYPEGTSVHGTLGPGRSYLMSPLAAGELVTHLSVEGFAAASAAPPRLAGLPFPLARDDPGRLALGERLHVPGFSLPYSSAHTIEITQT